MVRQLSENEIMRAIVGELMDAGIPANLRGYEYLKTSLRIVLEKPDKVFAAMKELYPAVAELYGVSPWNVERGIRVAIEACFTHGDLDWINERFKRQVDSRKGKLTNTAFIAGLADQIRLQLKAYDEEV